MKKRILVVGFIVFLIGFICFQNNAIEKTYIEYRNIDLSEEFNSFKIVQISDLHNKEFGENQARLLKKIEEESPDIIVITGDLVDRRKYGLERAMTFIRGAVNIAPIYYVSGNHEAWSGQYKTIKTQLKVLGVEVLDNRKIEIAKNSSFIEIIGLKDPDFQTSSYIEGNDIKLLKKHLDQLANENKFQILLSHRPELFDLYSQANIDLVFSGHAHGGQFRLPFIGGIIAPDQGLLPIYTSGLYNKSNSSMIVSRGLGNSIIPIRILNQPEIVILTLNN